MVAKWTKQPYRGFPEYFNLLHQCLAKNIPKDPGAYSGLTMWTSEYEDPCFNAIAVKIIYYETETLPLLGVILLQSCIQKPVSHLRWSFLRK